MRILIFCIIILGCVSYNALGDGISSIPNVKYHFPNGSGMGFFLALAVPLDLPNKSAFLAYNFQAHYDLPGDATFYDYPPLIARGGKGTGSIRSIDRQLVYDMLESKMNSAGFSGKECMLRTICEAAMLPVNNNGILGDLLHIILSPSTTKNGDDFPKDYQKAEEDGKLKECDRYNKNCTVSFLGVVSWIGHAF